MKIDFDLNRAILAKLEEQHLEDEGKGSAIAVDGYDAATVTYHVRYLYQGGLIEARDQSTKDGRCWRALRLTYQGHEFLQNMRSDTVWSKAKEVVLSATGTLSIEALKIASGKILRDLIG
ncbi:MAG: DUF2513 domain-containing protein [Bryobacterales bacterium]|nr:DUF2513 domain-containing protein [Bryobacterales bacterium]